ncbi:MAG: hypothetical protein QM820_46815 [Minicystis sp.]
MTRSHARFLLHADAALALLSGLMCMATPQLFVGSFFTTPLTAPGLCFVRLLGTMYVSYALMEWCVLARGDRGFWAVFLLACLAGDLAHLAVFLLGLSLPDAYWGFGAWANVAIVAFFFSLRIYLLRNLHLTDRDGLADIESPRAAPLPAPEVAA